MDKQDASPTYLINKEHEELDPINPSSSPPPLNTPSFCQPENMVDGEQNSQALINLVIEVD